MTINQAYGIQGVGFFVMWALNRLVPPKHFAVDSLLWISLGSFTALICWNIGKWLWRRVFA